MKEGKGREETKKIKKDFEEKGFGGGEKRGRTSELEGDCVLEVS